MGPALEAALERLTIPEVAAAAGRPIEWVNERKGLCRSPFPEYHKNGDKNPSFHIHHGLKGFTNYAGTNPKHNKGDAWKFAEECKPGASRGEIAAWLVEIAGTGHLSDKGPVAAKPRKTDIASAEYERKERAKKKREAAYALPPVSDEPRPWPEFLESRFFDATQPVAELEEKLAEARGWPIEWASAFLFTGLVSRPLLPWRDNGRLWSDTGWAFPCVSRQSMPSRCNTHINTAGYHQRFMMPSGPQWVFLPYAIDAKKVKTSFQRKLLEYRRALDIEAGVRMIEPMPFVVGNLDDPQAAIICEGQWDALTLAGSLGFVEDCCEVFPYAIFGLRGVKNAGQFFSHWGEWLRLQMVHGALRSAWIVADNDAAGRGLIESVAEVGRLARPCFKDILKENFPGLRVQSTQITTPGCKDFNDFYKRKRPSLAQMAGIVEDLGLIA